MPQTNRRWSPVFRAALPADANTAKGKRPAHPEMNQALSKSERVAGVTGLEPAASGVTGRRSNQLSYTPSGEAGPALRSTTAEVMEW